MSDAGARSSMWCAAALLLAITVMFLVLAGPRLSAPFGDSDEGINAAVWGYNSRSLRELGPVTSRLGGLRIDGTKYANHPPLSVVQAAVIERVVGEHPWSTRAPAWLGALATIAILFGLLREVVRDPVVAAGATGAALACHMFVVYGFMLDTMVTSFPFALGVLWLWYRQWTRRGDPHWVAIAGLSLAACLGGWQATFLVGLCGVATAARWRSTPGALRRSLAYLGAAVASTALTVLWAWWVYTSLGPLTDKLGRRSGAGVAASVAGMVDFQLSWLGQLLGLGLFAWGLTAWSLRDRRFRPLAAISLVSVLVYALVFREGSGGHQYWNYWGLLPAAVGWAFAMDAIGTALRKRSRKTWVPAAAVITLALVIAAFNLTRIDQAGALIDEGVRVERLVAESTFPPDQRSLPTIGEPYRADDWLRYQGRLPAENVASPTALGDLARAHPDHLVLVLTGCKDPDPTLVCAQVRSRDPGARARLLPAGALASSLVP